MNLLKIPLITFGLAFGAVGCSDVPKEAITLSVTIGKDIEELQRANIALVDLYFAEVKTDIRDFVENVYRPALIQSAIQDSKYPYDDGKEYGMLEILELESNRSDGDPVGFMSDFVALVTSEVDEQLQEMLEPVEQQEVEIRTSISAAHRQVINANSVVTGHLISLRKVQDAHEEFLRDVGLKNLRENTIEALVSTSDATAKITKSGKKSLSTLEDIEEVVENFKSGWRKDPAKNSP